MKRLDNIAQSLRAEEITEAQKHALTLTDQRTGKTTTIPIKESKDCYFIDSKDVGKLKDHDNEPVRVYDPGYLNTICNTSKICYIDGDKGVL